MGNKQEIPLQTVDQSLSYQRFVQYQKEQLSTLKPSTSTGQPTLKLDPFTSMDIETNPTTTSTPKHFQLQTTPKSLTITKYFLQQKSLQHYLSNLIKINKLLDITLYDQLKFQNLQSPYSSVITFQAKGFQRVDGEFLRKAGLERKLEFLGFVARFLRAIGGFYVEPGDIGEIEGGGFYLLNFSVDDTYDSNQIFLAFMRWLFTQPTPSFQTCLTLQDMPSNLPIYLQQIYTSLHHTKSLTVTSLQPTLQSLTDKMLFLQHKTDSFYACQYFNKTSKYANKNQWIFLKERHELFFYHIGDRHPFMGRIIRKKKKVDIGGVHCGFDFQDLELIYVPENSKYVVKAGEFEFQGCGSLSDIEIKFKLPLKFRNPLINRARNGDLLLLEQYLYRYVPGTNKLIQQTKRISDYVFLTSTRDSYAFIIKLSIDIFRNGIRVFYRNEEITLAHTGDPKILEQISSIRIDIRHVIFCIQVYKGVYLMMASKNMWILDLNFECYFSYATPSQLKKLTAFQTDKLQPSTSTSTQTQTLAQSHNDQLFTILNQPFKANLNIQNDGNNVAVKDNHLHILGKIEGKPYYLMYSFVHRIGALRLEGYHPLFVEAGFRAVGGLAREPGRQAYRFNFHEENSSLYKYRNWIFKGKLLVQVYDFRIQFHKTTYQVHLQIEPISQTLKSHLQHLSTLPPSRRLPHTAHLLLLYKIYQIYSYLFQNSITHSNISISHICFTQKKELKIFGWSEPARNWHVCDYKDFLLVCFNCIVYGGFQKCSERILGGYEQELGRFGVLGEKIVAAFKQPKTVQKHSQIQKSLLLIKSYLQKQLSTLLLHPQKPITHIISLEYKTPRLTLFNPSTQKLRKITIIPQETSNEEFIFEESDQYVWNQEAKALYVFTAAHQFYELKVGAGGRGTGNGTGNGEERMCLEDYQYLPNCINFCSFICDCNGDIYSFGGIKKETDGRHTSNMKIYKFNWKLLTWQTAGQLPEPRINPHLVLSACNKFIYILGGLINPQTPNLSLLRYNLTSQNCQSLHDPTSRPILSQHSNASPTKIWNLSTELALFVFWGIEDGEYFVRYQSFTAIGFEVELRVKNYSSENLLAPVSVALDGGFIHVLRAYGRYTKITVHKLEGLALKNETIYAI